MAKTILVVEDDFDTRHPLAELLRLRGYDVTTVPNADLALKAAREQVPDLILTDIILPGLTGLQLISAIRANQPTQVIPIIVISGCEPAVLKKAEQAGADFCLGKPIQLPLFWATIAGILEDNKTTIPQPWRRTRGKGRTRGRLIT
jgi:CheY-like chemotaxis protein